MMELPQNIPLLQNRQRLIKIINKVFSEIIRNTQNMPKGQSRYHAKQVPKAPILAYLQRISRFMHCSNAVYIIALIYIDRLQERLQDFTLNHYCIHKVLISSIVLAAKYNDDEYFKNKYYAKIGGIKIEELNALEIAFCLDSRFSFFVSPEQFSVYVDKLNDYLQINE